MDAIDLGSLRLLLFVKDCQSQEIDCVECRDYKNRHANLVAPFWIVSFAVNARSVSPVSNAKDLKYKSSLSG